MRNTADFSSLCREHGLAATHQRRVIYETVMSLHGHPSPELIYGSVRKKIPSISLATVYKNLRTFLESGMLREVSMHHGSLRVEPNESEHYHLVCTRCRHITDLEPVMEAALKAFESWSRTSCDERISLLFRTTELL